MDLKTTECFSATPAQQGREHLGTGSLPGDVLSPVGTGVRNSPFSSGSSSYPETGVVSMVILIMDEKPPLSSLIWPLTMMSSFPHRVGHPSGSSVENAVWLISSYSFS